MRLRLSTKYIRSLASRNLNLLYKLTIMEHLKKYGAIYITVLLALATHQLVIAPHIHKANQKKA